MTYLNIWNGLIGRPFVQGAIVGIKLHQLEFVYLHYCSSFDDHVLGDRLPQSVLHESPQCKQ